MLAIGLIEVIGLPPAIEAADAALKAASVKLIAIAKADAGILTVEITGDVGAVTAATDAGAAAASRIGTLRAKHIIPRVDESLIGKVIVSGTKLFHSESKLSDKTLEVKKVNENVTEDEIVENNYLSVPYNKETDKNNLNTSEEINTDSLILENMNENTLGEMVNETNKGLDNDDIDSGIKKIEDNSKSELQTDKPKEYTVVELKRMNNDALRKIIQNSGIEITEQYMSAKKQELIQLILSRQEIDKKETEDGVTR